MLYGHLNIDDSIYLYQVNSFDVPPPPNYVQSLVYVGNSKSIKGRIIMDSPFPFPYKFIITTKHQGYDTYSIVGYLMFE